MNESAQIARNAIRGLLDGGGPNGLDPSGLGPWQEVYEGLATAHTEGGTPAVHRVFSALARTHPSLATLTAGDEPETHRYRLRWAQEALEPQPPINWVVESVFSAPSVSLLYGDAGCGKTLLMIDLAVAVAGEAQWLGFPVNRGPSLIIDEEMGEEPLKRRIGEVLRGHRAAQDTRLAFTCHNRFDLFNRDDVSAIIDAIDEAGASLVVFDALMEFLPGRDENAVKDVLPGLMTLRDVATQTGTALVAIHHSNKNGGYRGSTALKGAVDNMLFIKKKGTLLTIATEKTRFTEDYTFLALMNFAPETFHLSPAAAGSGSATFGRAEKCVLQYLGRKGASLTSDISGHAEGCTDNAARRAIYSLRDSGFVERVDGGGQGTAATWGLTNKGQHALNNLSRPLVPCPPPKGRGQGGTSRACEADRLGQEGDNCDNPTGSA